MEAEKSSAQNTSASPKNLSWFGAFKLLLLTEPECLGKYRKLKSQLPFLALALPILVAYMQFDYADQYVGALPPEVPLIRATGILVEQSAGRRKTYFLLKTTQGAEYVISYRDVPVEISALLRKDPSFKFHIEGFNLRNGKGGFYMLKVTDIWGKDLVPPERLMQKLKYVREEFLIDMSVYYSFFFLFLWILLFYYLHQLRTHYAQPQSTSPSQEA